MIDVLLIISGFLLIFTGIIGAFIPVLPGPPLSYAGMILVHFSAKASFDPTILIITGIIALIITLIDYLLPVLGARTSGGSNYGLFGASLGLLAGLIFFPPFGIILGPLVGAFAAEIINNQPSNVAIKSAIGSFFGLMLAIVLKLMISSLIAWLVIKSVFF